MPGNVSIQDAYVVDYQGIICMETDISPSRRYLSMREIRIAAWAPTSMKNRNEARPTERILSN